MQQAERVGLVDAVSVAIRFDVEFVERALGYAGDEAFPDAGRAARAETMCLGIPSVEAADHRNGSRIGCPHAEDGSRLAIVRDQVGSHLVVQAVVAALVEEVEVLVGQALRGGDNRGTGVWGHRTAVSSVMEEAGCPSKFEVVSERVRGTGQRGFRQAAWFPD